jgi:hypothetical protein
LPTLTPKNQPSVCDQNGRNRGRIVYPLTIPQMFYLTSEEYGHTDTVAEFATLDDAQDALSRLYDALEDCHGSGYSIRCAIAELEEQIGEHLMALECKE